MADAVVEAEPSKYRAMYSNESSRNWSCSWSEKSRLTRRLLERMPGVTAGCAVVLDAWVPDGGDVGANLAAASRISLVMMANASCCWQTWKRVCRRWAWRASRQRERSASHRDAGLPESRRPILHGALPWRASFRCHSNNRTRGSKH